MAGEFYTYILYLFYGLAFFTMGVSITSRDTRFSNLKIAGHLWLFALFAYTHAAHEWSEFFLLFHPFVSDDLFVPLNLGRIILVLASFLFLLQFGIRILNLSGWARRWSHLIIPGILLLWLGALYFYGLDLTFDFFQYADQRLRNFIGLPSAILAGAAFCFYSRTIRHLSHSGARNLLGAGCVLMVYGVLTGIVPSGTTLAWLDIRIEFLRGLAAIAILHFLMNGLRIFDIEYKAIIEDSLQRFAKSEKLTSMGKLAAGVAHEINNPLTNVSLNVELLKKDLLPEARSQIVDKRFAAMERNLERASRIAQELLYFSREDETQFIEEDLHEIILRTVGLLEIQHKQYRLCYDFADLPQIEAVPWKVEEVLLNILSNAIDASPPGGKIIVKTSCSAEEVCVEIIDRGIGIAPQHLNKVFDPFFTTKEVGQGTGLGLAICYGIMELHNGSIEIESEPGTGTTVSLVFPLTQGSAKSHGQNSGR